jgi:hypothetical protein
MLVYLFMPNNQNMKQQQDLLANVRICCAQSNNIGISLVDPLLAHAAVLDFTVQLLRVKLVQ